MKLSSFLAATSVAALLAGGANAAVDIVHVGGSVPSGYKIANEVDFTALATANGDLGTYQLQVRTDGTIPPGQNLFLEIEVTNGKFTTALTGAEFTSGTTGAVVDSGGQVNGSRVRYLITTDIIAVDPDAAGPKVDHIALTLPVDIIGCGSLSFAVTEFRTESGGTPIEGGAATQLPPSVTCVSAFNATIAPDVDVTTLAFNNGFSTFVVTASDTADLALVGNAALTVDSTVKINMSGLSAAATQVLGFEASVDFQNGTNAGSVVAAPVAGTLFDDTAPVVGNSAALVGVAPATANDTGTVSIDLSAVTGPVAAQVLTVSGAALNLNTALNLKATDAFSAADVQDLVLNGQIFGPFDWVNDLNGAVNNVFRMTNLGALDVPVKLILTNSNTGVNGTFPFTILASEIVNGEYRLNRQKIRAVVGSDFGTADVTIVLSTGNTVDIDRLMVTAANNAVVTSFGDGSNQDGNPDLVAQPTNP